MIQSKREKTENGLPVGLFNLPDQYSSHDQAKSYDGGVIQTFTQDEMDKHKRNKRGQVHQVRNPVS